MLSPNLKNQFSLDIEPKVLPERLHLLLGVPKVNHSELIITDRFEGKNKLVWEVRYFSQGLTIGWIDANSGELIGKQSGYYNIDNELKSISKEPTIFPFYTTNSDSDKAPREQIRNFLIDINGPTEDYGIQIMNSRNNGNNIELASEDGLVLTYDFNQTNVLFIDPNDYITDLIPTMPNTQAAWTAADADQSVFQAHWMVHNSVGTFADLGIDFELMHVGSNCSPDPVQGPNAFSLFGSTLDEGWILFSDVTNNGTTLAEYDIVGHEMAHTYLNEFLDYTNNANASLHEGISDMFGVFIESEQQELDWQIGDNVPITIRDLENPLFSCFTNVQNLPPGFQHDRSTPLGHWFFLAVTGSGTNTDIVALDINIMMDILNGGLEGLNNRNADYPQFRTATLDFADGEYGVCSQEYRTLVAAWDEICVTGTSETCPCDTYATPTLTANSAVIGCSATSLNLNQFFNGTLPQGSTLIWSTDNDPIDGVDPIISSVVNASGTYYAYYQNAVANCFSLPSLGIVVTAQTQTADLTITAQSTTTITGNQYFGGNLIIENGATVHMHTGVFTFFTNKGIIVRNGGKLILQSATINACDPTLAWTGIKVQTGGFFDTDNTTLLNVSNGVDAKANSTIQIFNLTMYGKGKGLGTGIYLDGKVNNDFINTVHINDFEYGIRATNGNSYYGFTIGTIDNVKYGIVFNSSPSVVSNFNIYNADHAIDCTLSPGSMILDNEINFFNLGISSLLSANTIIQGNSVRQPNSTGNVGVSVVLSPDCNVQDNTNIEGRTSGVVYWLSSGTVARNSVEVTGNNTSIGGGINIIGSTGNQVIDNYVFAMSSAFGIETNWSNGTEIKNNESVVFSYLNNVRSAAIRSAGNTGEIIEDNRVECLDNATGILIQNSSSNIIKCNDVISPDEGLGIYNNSEQQGIIGNELTGTTQDLTIRSVIGTQDHEGNKFYGGNATAIGLTAQQILTSKFFANGAIANNMPPNPIPGGNQWFESVPGSDYQCSGLSGPGWTPFNGGDPSELCAYWNYLKSIKNSNPEQFYIKLYHLLKYAKGKPSFVIPNCIKIDPIFLALCGITKIVSINAALTEISTSKVNSTTLDGLQLQYSNATNQLGKLAVKNQLKTEMEVKIVEYNAAKSANDTKLDSLKNELNLLNCTQVIVQKWKEVMKLYIDFLKNNGQVSSQNMAATMSYSADCSDLYGDMVHLARAMANTFDQTNYETNDNCLNVTTPRIVQESSKEFTCQVSPNPSTGLINIEMANFSGDIVLKSFDGRIIDKKVVINSVLESFDLSNRLGVYLVELKGLNGEMSSHKVIIIE